MCVSPQATSASLVSPGLPGGGGGALVFGDDSLLGVWSLGGDGLLDVGALVAAGDDGRVGRDDVSGGASGGVGVVGGVGLDTCGDGAHDDRGRGANLRVGRVGGGLGEGLVDDRGGIVDDLARNLGGIGAGDVGCRREWDGGCVFGGVDAGLVIDSVRSVRRWSTGRISDTA